jgi:hypothetical protein
MYSDFNDFGKRSEIVQWRISIKGNRKKIDIGSNFVSLLPVANNRSAVPNIFCSGNITRNNGSLGDFGKRSAFCKSW